MQGQTRRSFRQEINQAIAEKRLLKIPGAYDALSARLIEQIGFSTFFIGGFPVVGARYGVPDIGLKGLGEISEAVRNMVDACSLPAFVDADDGYGDVKNAVHTTHVYERMGVSGLCFEDQAWPKRCGHMVGKSVVPMELMEAKIRAATSERMNPETFILARCDARQSNGLDDAMRRAERYIEAGADAIFVEAPESLEELELLSKSFKGVPQFANPLIGGRTPIRTPKELEEMGFAAICFGLDTIMHAAKAMKAVLLDMYSGEFKMRYDGMEFDEFRALVGYDDWAGIDDRLGWPRRAEPTTIAAQKRA